MRETRESSYSNWGDTEGEAKRETHGSQIHQTCLCSPDLHHISRSVSHTLRWHSETLQRCSLPYGWTGRGPHPRRSAPAPHPNCQSSRGLRHNSTWVAHTLKCYSAAGWAHRWGGRCIWAHRCHLRSHRPHHIRTLWPSTCGLHTWTLQWGRLWHLQRDRNHQSEGWSSNEGLHQLSSGRLWHLLWLYRSVNILLPSLSQHRSEPNTAFSFSAPIFLNKLPEELRSAETLSSIKSELKTFPFINNPWTILSTSLLIISYHHSTSLKMVS